MTAEVAILRAYAFASQGQYAEAEQMLASVPEALNTPSGADLLARIRFEQGDEPGARRIWERLLAADPSNESARKALDALDAQSEDSASEEEVHSLFRKRKNLCVIALAVLLGFVFLLGRACRGPSLANSSETSRQRSQIIAEQSLDASSITSKTLRELSNGVLTNMSCDAVLVLSGGRGKYATDRARNLSVLAECISSVAGIPMTNVLFRVGDASNSSVLLTIVHPVRGEERSLDGDGLTCKGNVTDRD